ncbi:alpha/beta fold hydrolase [Catenulispora sp. NL8]|uniref:Alpha/beta fold hydrolase n=1 Tax=Catenulispora pinistramenti TaxID=2705254 RepID=A0ABS5KIT2_9ACTN|nr:alpha/beta hydrolase [Catenulispora pinistramenti]MBS2545830.1 alpha/beta fold hydrolase [Catenulispora pinistramenti]
MRQSVEIQFPTGAGSYAVTRWPAPEAAVQAPPVIAAHGITANGLAWAPLAEALPETDFIAPDLRGRGRSREVGGPYSMAAHADDLVRTLDHLGVERATLLGHSMGGWVVAAAAVRHPERFGGAVLVDGGLGFQLPEGTDLDQLLDAVLGPAMAKLRTVFASREEFLAPWRNHPSLVDVYSPAVEAYQERDIIGTEPELRSSCVLDAIRDDAADELQNPDVVGAIHRLPMPAVFLHAERGLLNEPVGLYSPEAVAAAKLADAGVDVRFVPGTNHYSILLGDRGIAAVAEAVRALR